MLAEIRLSRVSEHRVQSRLLSAVLTDGFVQFLLMPVRRSYVNEKTVLFCSNNPRRVIEVSSRWRHDRTLSWSFCIMYLCSIN